MADRGAKIHSQEIRANFKMGCEPEERPGMGVSQLTALLAMGFLLMSLCAFAQYDLSWWTSEGGGNSTAGSYTVIGVAGQPDAGLLSGGSYTLQGGFLAVGIAQAPPTPSPTETPIETPTPSPTETPAETPTPSPTPWIVFDFVENCSDWTTHTVPLAFSEPDFICDVGALRTFSTGNTNNFGYWQSTTDAVPIASGYVYRARFSVATDTSDQSVVPQVRVRANSLNLQQADYLSIESTGNGGASPAPGGTDYDLYFVPPANDTFMMLAFDLLNFNPADAPTAELALTLVTVERYALNEISTPTFVMNYTFDVSTDGWTTGGAPIVFAPPGYVHADGALQLRATNSTNTFGYWQSDAGDIVVEADRVYRATFAIRTDVTDRSRVPQIRLRLNSENLQVSRTLGIESVGDGGTSPGTTDTIYDNLYLVPPASGVGEGLIISFDLLNFTPGDAPDGSAILDSVTVEYFDLPIYTAP